MKQEPIDAEWTDPKAGVLHPELGRRAYRAYAKIAGAVITVMLVIVGLFLLTLPLARAALWIPT